MEDPNQPEDTEFVLTMPFVLVKSFGGPYDDSAFVSGFRLGAYETELKVLSRFSGIPQPRYVPPVEKAQMDLIAMQFGYKVEYEDLDEHWTLATTIYAPEPIIPQEGDE